ncbi:hypothetical protein [Leucobacter sp. wl10]|uniref:hypothetical protein n=1 Tax=Leucobacter sp. wl10 TaxID=2304677 RepID=UPI000E5B55BF|nr:hypothetical protein [Leucobacter sp. wl10]RGE19475.1 hypothetical protein D1J51_11500 [Leucobacter sp. wl10]
MAERLSIRDDALAAAGAFLVTAAGDLAAGRSAPPAAPASLTGIGGEVRGFLGGLQTGRLALADAAKTASEQIAGVMQDSSDLDARVARTLDAGFAVTGSGR